MTEFLFAFSWACAGIAMVILVVESLMALSNGHFNPSRRFKKGHIREYDPSGVYTYKDQNPEYRRK